MKKILLLLLLCVPMIGLSQCISGDCGNGYGTFIFDEGDKYVGEWKEGKYHGLGTYTWGSGPNKDDKYVGEFKYGNSYGQGTYTWGSGPFKGDKYVGEWRDGKKDGLGIYLFSSGERDISYYYKGKETKRLCDF